MKSLVPWMCLIAATASQPVLADDDFHAYRIGNYNKASQPLISKTDKDPIANYYLGRLYLYGYGHLKNNSLAMRYFEKSATKGYLPAVMIMAKYSLLHDKNPVEAMRWFKQAAGAGDVNAQMFMAAAYMFGLGVKVNQDLATKYYIDAAKNGDPIAQYTLAEHFIDSRHSANNKLGLIWLNKSANSGNVKAITKLGALYADGKLVPQDWDKGVALLNQAIAKNYAPAMVELGEAYLAKGEYPKAIEWFNKAANYQDSAAYLHLAHAYLQDKSPLFDPKAGFLWTLKAAQDGLPEAQKDLANLYKKGIGVDASDALARQWDAQAAYALKQQNNKDPQKRAALWLTDNKTDQLDKTNYQMQGIFSSWNNPIALKNNIFNKEPKLEVMSQKALFKPQFVLTQPNEVPINNYYDALISKNFENRDNQWAYPSYSLNKNIEAIERVNSMVLNRNDLPAPYIDANYVDDDYYSNPALTDIWMQGWQQQVNYMSVFNELYFRALLGEAQSQFEIGQMFQYGIGVAQNDQSAIIFYQNAAEQQHLGAEYNLGLLYLQHPKDAADYQVALNWLTDSAFKGNRKAQYVLAKLLNDGKNAPDGKEYIKANKEQALSMLYLSAANSYGPAEFQLAEHLAREYDSGLSVEVKQHKLALIRQLYQGAASSGVSQALLPLAFYNAMDQDKARQANAFSVAEEQANTGDQKAALLLGMLYDRGIGVTSDSEKAMYWYQQSGKNPVTDFILGTYTTEGKGVALNKDKGIELLKESANHDFSYADFNLAVLNQQAGSDFLPQLTKAYTLGYSHAGIVLADYYLSEQNGSDNEIMNQAKKIYTGLAQKGDQYAQLKLAYMLDNGLGSPPDAAAAQQWYTAAAEQGNPIAQYMLGQFYQIGETGLPDYNLAKDYYQKAAAHLAYAAVALGFLDETVNDNYAAALNAYQLAAQKGDPLGIYNLGLMYFYGKGVPVDYTKATQLFTQAANKGVYEAMTQLAGIYFNGLGQSHNEQQGITWYKKAAELGDSNALYELGLLSETGVGTSLDFAQAIKYYQQASDKGNEKAMLALARMYRYGLGVDKDLKRSASVYQQLADRQNAYAQYQLGTFYLEGIAGDHSIDKGRQLLEKARDNGSVEAVKSLEKLNAQNQGRLSFIEPVSINQAPVMAGQSPDRMYLEALNEWNRGDEAMSRMILQRLVRQYPHFVPAKKVFEQLNQAKINTVNS